MFAGQQQVLGRSQLFVHKSYRISDVWGRGGDGDDQLAIRKKTSDAAIFRDLDPDLKSRVLLAGVRSANNKSLPEDQVLEAKIEGMLEDGSLEPSIAAALLRIIHTAPEPESNFQVLNPSLSTRSDGASDSPDRFYDPTKPWPGKRAGLTMDMVKNYARSHGIVLGSPARGARWR